MVEESELIAFASNPLNDIRIRECDSNALKFYKKYGGEICRGYATYIRDNVETTGAHYWNAFKSNTGNEFVQIVDIINYKIGEQGTYKNHRMEKVYSNKESIQQLEKQWEHDRNIFKGIVG